MARTLFLFDQILIKFVSLLGDGRPAEVLDRALAASFTECFAALWVFHESVDLMGQILGEGFTVERCEWALVALCERHKVACLIMHDDFRDAADG